MNNVQVQVGKAAFSIELPFSYGWRPSDMEFFGRSSEPWRNVQVKIRTVSSLREPEAPPVHQKDGITVWQDGGAEIRAYRAMFASGNPLYVISRWSGTLIHVDFLSSSNVWNHPNMQLWNLLHLENQLLLSDSLILHCCYTQYRGGAILFTAPSGTGKTTQAEIWKRLYQAEIINGDKGLLQKECNGWNACGFPLHGSAPECKNQASPISAIVVVRQASENRIEALRPVQKLGLLYSECTVNPWNPSRVQKALDLLSELITAVPVVMLHCTMDDDAAHVLHRYLYGE